MTSLLAAALCLLLLGGDVPAKHPAASGIRLRKTIALEGDEHVDHLALDAETRRLFLTRDTKVVVLDLGGEKVLGEIAARGARGVALAWDLKRGFSSNGGDDTVSIFDTAKLKEVGRVPVGPKPDAILYDPWSRRVLVFGALGDLTAIDAAGGEVLGSSNIEGRPAAAVTDARGSVYVSVEDKNELACLDPKTLSVTARWPLAPCEAPHGLAMDTTRGRLFVGCRSQTMAVVDASSGSVLKTLPIGKGVDDVAFDTQRRLAFAANGDGSLTVVKEEQDGGFRVVENATTLPGARRMVLDERRRTIYMVTCRFGTPPPPTEETPRPQAPIVPGTFTVLVFN